MDMPLHVVLSHSWHRFSQQSFRYTCCFLSLQTPGVRHHGRLEHIRRHWYISSLLRRHEYVDHMLSVKVLKSVSAVRTRSKPRRPWSFVRIRQGIQHGTGEPMLYALGIWDVGPYCAVYTSCTLAALQSSGLHRTLVHRQTVVSLVFRDTILEQTSPPIDITTAFHCFQLPNPALMTVQFSYEVL